VRKSSIAFLNSIKWKVAQDTALRIAEIPDRDSPDDQPQMMLATRQEIERAVVGAFDRLMEE
jgi:hypothetical protein